MMQSYKHNIGDYDASTYHLTWMEDAAYSKMLRLYYKQEAPLTKDFSFLCKQLRAEKISEQKAIRFVLNTYFTEDNDGWRNHRCDREIVKKQAQVSINKETGKRGGRPRLITESVMNEKPNRIQNKNRNGTESVMKPKPKCNRIGFDEFWSAYPKKTGKALVLSMWDRINESDIEKIMAALAWQKQSEQWVRDGGQYIPNPATWLNQRRWEDEPIAVDVSLTKSGRQAENAANQWLASQGLV